MIGSSIIMFVCLLTSKKLDRLSIHYICAGSMIATYESRVIEFFEDPGFKFS